ncbi:MAG TPA: NADH-quinone oxidoreductase subunit NuoN [Burkholderiaceae bacterium]|nr:NADH-quinone oxidoreductase subunit NuoN [Burkholderiaceae bacterium]HMX10898.1 NADH-quinone oxidoreductase subunit NuoN [Burkholderiaceae bacterium]HNB44647.1 NADH-quinone oxidoreductase subunit NuoN [Burkholderiaceae bacterium]HNG79446.1 NADH-quinone oxidoreductase subunit NuoN [Burkholderiaceae bacterium]
MNAMNWLAVYPEILLLLMACVVALVDLFVTDPRRTPTYVLSLLTLAGVGAMHLAYFNGGLTHYAMNRMVVTDPMGHLLAFFACVAVAITLIYARPYAESRDILKGELFSLSLLSLLGISIMLSGNNFLVLYLGLEVMSLSLYAIVALRRDHGASTEAAMKYFVLGAIASGFLLYGMSMMYGATGSLDLGKVFEAIGKGDANRQVLVFGVVFIVSGLAFKFGAVPFHMWVPDVYQGAPTAATLLIAGAPKIAAFGMTIRVLVEGLLGLAVDWQQMLVVLAVCSLVVGNLAAIAQTNLKRMLAYSTIAQMGFMMLGLVSGVVNGNTLSAANAYSSAMFYMITYVVTTLGTFGLIMLMAREGFESEEIADFAGLNQRSPLLAGVMSVFMFSLAGIPPTVGFYAKLAVLQALISTNDSFHLGLAIFAVVLSLIGAFYYLRIVKVMYFDEPSDTSPITAPSGARTVLSLNGAAVLLLGLLPGGLMAMCAQAIVKALAT